MPGGRVTPERGFPPHIPHLRARVSRDRGRCLATPSLGQGETLSCGSLTACPLGLALGRHTAGDRRVHRAGQRLGQSHKAVTASGDWGLDPLGRYPGCHREDDPVGHYRVLPASRVVRGPHPRGGILIFPVPASRGGMASATAPDASAAMAVDREAEGAGALLGPEEDIDDDVLAILLSASWPTPAVVYDQYGLFSWTPLVGSIVEQRYDAIDSRRMTSIWTTIRGMYDSFCAFPEGTVTDFPFLRSRENWRVCQVHRHLAVREIPPEVGEKPHFSWDYYPGSPPTLGEMDSGVYVPGALGEWTIHTSLRVLTLYEQREVRDVPVVRRKALYPTTPVWCEHVEVPRGMAAPRPRGEANVGPTKAVQPPAQPIRQPRTPPPRPVRLPRVPAATEGSAQFGTPSPVNPAIWSSLGRSLGELPSMFNNGVDHTLIMALSRTLVRLRNEVSTIVSRPLGERDVVPLYQLGTVETLRRYLTEEYGTAVVDTNTVVAGWTLRHLAASSAPPRGVALPAAPRRPPSPPPPHYGAGAGSSHAHYGAGAGSSSHAPYGAGVGSSSQAPYGAGAGSSSQALYGAETGPLANPPRFSEAHYYAPEPEEDRSQDYDFGYGARPGGW